jgi:hypothetical protein
VAERGLFLCTRGRPQHNGSVPGPDNNVLFPRGVSSVAAARQITLNAYLAHFFRVEFPLIRVKGYRIPFLLSIFRTLFLPLC